MITQGTGANRCDAAAMRRIGGLKRGGYFVGYIKHATAQLGTSGADTRIGAEPRRHLELHYTLQERQRLARDLHDGVAQDIAYASSLAKRLVEDTEQGQVPDLEQLRQISRILDQSLVELRQAIYDLTLCPDEDLCAYIQRYLADFQSRFHIPVSFQVEGEVPPLDPYVSNQVLKVLQEALANVRKHADARKVDVRLQRVYSRGAETTAGVDILHLTIADDGRGFAVDEARPPEHYGLRTMRERCQTIGGSCQISSGIGRGTVVQVEIPLS
jgi:signal transduction histidine kinase